MEAGISDHQGAAPDHRSRRGAGLGSRAGRGLGKDEI